jgi:hypothetical protein
VALVHALLYPDRTAGRGNPDTTGALIVAGPCERAYAIITPELLIPHYARYLPRVAPSDAICCAKQSATEEPLS